jgi:hypothetical protein
MTFGASARFAPGFRGSVGSADAAPGKAAGREVRIRTPAHDDH